MRFAALLVFLLFCVFAIFARKYWVCNVKQLCEEVTEEVVEEERLKTLRLITSDSIVIMDGFDQFVFDSASYLPNLNGNNELFLDSLVTFFNAIDTSYNLNITGFYRSTEDSIKGTFFDNIGLERASKVRELLVQRGMLESRITLDHGIAMNDSLLTPLRFDAYQTGVPEEFERLQHSLTNYTFPDSYFDFDSDKFIPGESFEIYADSVKTFLEQNPDKEITVIGHTDNKGGRRYNYSLGLRRAKSVKEYLEEFGIEVDINTLSEGKSKPVASNETEEGRSRNRRVNCKIE